MLLSVLIPAYNEVSTIEQDDEAAEAHLAAEVQPAVEDATAVGGQEAPRQDGVAVAQGYGVALGGLGKEGIVRLFIERHAPVFDRRVGAGPERTDGQEGRDIRGERSGLFFRRLPGEVEVFCSDREVQR
jgi:hypothetical protein